MHLSFIDMPALFRYMLTDYAANFIGFVPRLTVTSKECEFCLISRPINTETNIDLLYLSTHYVYSLFCGKEHPPFFLSRLG